MAKNNKGEKKSQGEMGSSAQGLLRRINNRYDATRVEAEKSAMKNLDSREESDASAPDVVKYSATAEMPKAKSRKKKTDPSVTGEISDEELQGLFDKYLGGDNASTTSEPADYDNVHRMILDAEKRSGVDSMPKNDVEKTIDEAEKYIDSIENSDNDSMSDADGEKYSLTGSFGVSVDSTEQLSAFEPDEKAPAEEPKKETVINFDESASFETDPHMMTTDTAMMKAFGLDPSSDDVTKESRILSEFSLSDTSDLQSTTDISSLEKEGEKAAEVTAPKKEEGGFEYTDSKQNKLIISIFKSKYIFAKARIILAVALAILLFSVENLASVKDIFTDNTMYIAVDWLLTFACAAIVFDRLVKAIKSLGKFVFDVDTVTLVSLVLSLIVTVVTMVTASSYDLVSLYNFPFAICVLLNTIAIFYSLRRDVYSFKIVSSSKVKKSLVPSSEQKNERIPEKIEFAEFLDEEAAEVCKIKKADFISDFFAHRKEPANAKFPLKIFLPVCLIASIVFFFIALLVMEHSVSESMGVAYAAFMMSAPFASFLSYCYPLYLASRRAYSYNCAILSDKTPENYKDTAVVAFRDEDAFPAGKTKVKSIKLYADRKIENVIYYASSVYSKLGGPLATVFKQATLNSINSENIEIREVSGEGVCAMVDGKNIVIGRPAYMENQCFETMPEEGDDVFEGQSNRRILYLACEQIVIAKFYIQYSTTSDFVYIARHLAECGIGTSIRTADPCIDDGILYDNKMNPEHYPVKVVKGLMAEEKSEIVSAKQGGIVSVGTTKELVKTLLLCDRLENVKRINLILKVVACILAFAVMTLVLFTAQAPTMLSVFPALYQLFWLIPIYFVSKIYI